MPRLQKTATSTVPLRRSKRQLAYKNPDANSRVIELVVAVPRVKGPSKTSQKSPRRRSKRKYSSSGRAMSTRAKSTRTSKSRSTSIRRGRRAESKSSAVSKSPSLLSNASEASGSVRRKRNGSTSVLRRSPTTSLYKKTLRSTAEMRFPASEKTERVADRQKETSTAPFPELEQRSARSVRRRYPRKGGSRARTPRRATRRRSPSPRAPGNSRKIAMKCRNHRGLAIFLGLTTSLAIMLPFGIAAYICCSSHDSSPTKQWSLVKSRWQWFVGNRRWI